MGCDIHLHAEVKVENEWHHYAEIDVRRNYNLFSLMAGVRGFYEGSPTPIHEPRGLPSDMSVVTNISYKECDMDAHSASYLRSDEIGFLMRCKELWDKDTPSWEYFGFFFGNCWGDDKKEWPKDIQDLRWVFWFDN